MFKCRFHQQDLECNSAELRARLWIQDKMRSPRGVRKEHIFLFHPWPCLAQGWAHGAGKKSLQLRYGNVILKAGFYLGFSVERREKGKHL